MRLTKYSVAINTTSMNSSTGGYFTSQDCPNGFVYMIEYVQSAASGVPSTGTIQIYAGSTDKRVLTRTAGTTWWREWPRGVGIESSGASTAAIDPQFCYPLSTTEHLIIGITGGTSAATTGIVNIYVEGV
jgi:hypothetical protein